MSAIACMFRLKSSFVQYSSRISQIFAVPLPNDGKPQASNMFINPQQNKNIAEFQFGRQFVFIYIYIEICIHYVYIYIYIILLYYILELYYIYIYVSCIFTIIICSKNGPNSSSYDNIHNFTMDYVYSGQLASWRCFGSGILLSNWTTTK